MSIGLAAVSVKGSAYPDMKCSTLPVCGLNDSTLGVIQILFSMYIYLFIYTATLIFAMFHIKISE